MKTIMMSTRFPRFPRLGVIVAFLCLFLEPTSAKLLSSCECGEENAQMRSMGSLDSPLYYPWMAAVIDKEGYSYCGATLIADQYLLTAAHCVKGKTEKEVKVVLGVHNLGKVKDSDKYAVERFVVHSKFKQTGDRFENDLAIIKLKVPVKMTANIIPICLPKKEDAKPTGGLTVLGWGQLSPDTVDKAQKLQMLTLPEVPADKCSEVWGFNVTADQVCMGLPMKNICKGDDGGPLMVEIGTGWHQVGVVSFSGPQCGDKYPGVYSRITSYLDWIADNTGDSDSCSEPKPH